MSQKLTTLRASELSPVPTMCLPVSDGRQVANRVVIVPSFFKKVILTILFASSAFNALIDAVSIPVTKAFSVLWAITIAL